jgi:hypothetical protein
VKAFNRPEKMACKKIFLFLMLIFISISLVFASHIIRNSLGGSSYSFNEDSSYLYNISVNNSDSGQNANITQVNLTIPNGFVFYPLSGTDTFASFTNTSTIMSWSNFSGYVVNGGDIRYFWFNLSSANPGYYNLTVTTLNVSGIYSSNITLNISDITAPYVSFVTPVSGGNYSGNLLLNTSINDSSSVSLVYFNITDLSGAHVNITTASHLGSTVYWNATFSTSSLLDGYYNITVYANDSANNMNNSEKKQFMIDNTAPLFSILSRRAFVNHSFNYVLRATDNLVIGAYVLNNYTDIFNLSSTGVLTNISQLNTTGEYYLNVSVNDSLGNTNYTFFLVNVTANDTYVPVVNLLSPADGYSSSSTSINFVFNVSDDSATTCYLILNGSVVYTNTSMNINYGGNDSSYSTTKSVGTYNWRVNCTDIYGNTGNSSVRTFTITSSSSDGSDGGSSGGASNASLSVFYYPLESQLKSGYKQTLRVNDGFKFNLNNTFHSVILKSIATSGQVTVSISSDPITITLNSNETKKVDINGDKFYELVVTNTPVSNLRAIISVKTISEPVPAETLNVSNTNQTNSLAVASSGLEKAQQDTSEEKTNLKNYLLWGFVVALILVILIVMILLVYKIRKKEPQFSESNWKM